MNSTYEIKYILPVFPALLVYVDFNLMSHPALYFYLYRYSTCTCIATFILNTVISIPFGNFENLNLNKKEKKKQWISEPAYIDSPQRACAIFPPTDYLLTSQTPRDAVVCTLRPWVEAEGVGLCKLSCERTGRGENGLWRKQEMMRKWNTVWENKRHRICVFVVVVLCVCLCALYRWV